MVTLTSASNALKNVYLDVVANQLNTKVNPFCAMIEKTSNYVSGNTIIKAAPVGLNGGIGAGTEDGALPMAGGQNYVKFQETLKNLYGRISISDKAIRASVNDAGAFVNLLNAEMDSLITASQFNFSRMLFGNGTGKLATVVSVSGTNLTMDDVRNFIAGQIVDIYSANGELAVASVRVNNVDRANKTISISDLSSAITADCYITVQNSKDNEITGVEALFDTSVTTLYGLDKSANSWLAPYTKAVDGSITDAEIQLAIDSCDENNGSVIDYITCGSKVRRAYQAYLANYKSIVDVMELEGGFKAISYSGIPVVTDRFVEDGSMLLLNSKDFKLHQLCDWKWLEGENGNILKQDAGFATYTATLVKYADLMCDRPAGQAKLTGISA